MPQLLAGVFTSPPAFIQVMRAGITGFYDIGNESCWSDPQGRSLVSSRHEAALVLQAHGYELGNPIPAVEGAVPHGRIAVHAKGNPPIPAPDESVDELTKALKEITQLRARVAELEQDKIDMLRLHGDRPTKGRR